MRALVAILLISLSLTAIAGSALTPDEVRLVKDLRFDADLMARVKANGLAFERLQGNSPDGRPYPAAGLVLVTEPEQAIPVLQSVRHLLRDSGYRAYVNLEEFGTANDNIAIVHNLDDYGYLALVRPNGREENVSFEQVLAMYRKWDREFALELTGAGSGWLEARTTRSPMNWVPAARDVQALCRRCIGEGAENPETLAANMKGSKSFYLFWE